MLVPGVASPWHHHQLERMLLRRKIGICVGPGSNLNELEVELGS